MSKEKKGTFRDRIIILGLIAVIIFMFFKYYSRGKIDSPDTATVILLDSLRVTVDKLGREKAELTQVILTEKGVSEAFKKAMELAKGEKLAAIERMWEIHKRALNEVKDLKGEVKELTSVLANAQDQDTVRLTDTILVVKNEIIEAWAFDKSDEFLDFKGVVFPVERKLTYAIGFDVSFSHAVYDLPGGGSKVNLMFESPYIRNKDAFSVTIEPPPKQKQFGLGVFLGSNLDGNVSYGPQLEWRSMKLDIPVTRGSEFRISKRLFSF